MSVLEEVSRSTEQELEEAVEFICQIKVGLFCAFASHLNPPLDLRLSTSTPFEIDRAITKTSWPLFKHTLQRS